MTTSRSRSGSLSEGGGIGPLPAVDLVCLLSLMIYFLFVALMVAASVSDCCCGSMNPGRRRSFASVVILGAGTSLLRVAPAVVVAGY